VTLVLASSSPRRAEMLRALGVEFTTDAAALDEEAMFLEVASPSRRAVLLALAKGRAVAARHPGARVLAADTLVLLDAESLAKPRDAAEALWMLSRLSGRSQEVITGVAVVEPDGTARTGFSATGVKFARWPSAALLAYARSDGPRDKAGAYGLQQVAGAFVADMAGPADNVVGLPRALVMRLLGDAPSTIPQESARRSP
jgi:septum formation protein